MRPSEIGVEHEYRVLDRSGAAVDFRELIGSLRLAGGGLDPADPNAHHLPSGVLVTADGKEAEVATPPVELVPGSTRTVSAWSEHAEHELLGALPAGFGLEGFSTHLNIGVQGDVVALAQRFAGHFSRAMLALTELADSPGILVRPRRGRLEIGTEFVEGEQLRAALTFAVAAARRCATSVDAPTVKLRVTRVRDRPGWFAPHDLLGDDWRDALRESWAMVRDSLEGSDAEERALVDDLVAGRRPIPLEHVAGPDGCFAADLQSPFAALAGRDGIEVAALSWAAVAMRVRDDVHVVVPRAALAGFVGRWRAGDLDAWFHAGCGGDAPVEGTRVVRGRFDPRSIVPDEPRVPRPWWQARRVELAGAAAGATAVAAAYALWAR